jgi:hypothetical protein
MGDALELFNAQKRKIRASFAADKKDEAEIAMEEISKMYSELMKATGGSVPVDGVEINLSKATEVDNYLGEQEKVVNEKRKRNESEEVPYQFGRQKLSDLVKYGLKTGKILPTALVNPTVEDELTYHRKCAESDKMLKMDEKALMGLPDFNGESPDPEMAWRQFEEAFMVAVRYHKMTEANLMTCLFAKVKGNAQMQMMAMKAVNLPFSSIMQKMREEYTKDTLQAQNQVMNLRQGKETVSVFAAKIQVYGSALYPTYPGKLKVFRADAKCYVIPNPIFEQEMSEYESRKAVAEVALTRYFLAGLRREIQDRLPVDEYSSFPALVEAAKKSEWMVTSIQSGMLRGNVHHLGNDEGEVHAIRGKGNKGPEKGIGGGNAKGPCYECNEMGHIKKFCPKLRLQGSQRSSTFMTFNRPKRFSENRSRGKFMNTKNGRRVRIPEPIFKKIRIDRFGQRRKTPRNPNTRQWMVRNRARYEARKRYERQLYTLEGEEYDENANNEISEEEEILFNLEGMMSEEEREDYAQEVEEVLEQLENELEQIQEEEEESKN